MVRNMDETSGFQAPSNLQSNCGRLNCSRKWKLKIEDNSFELKSSPIE